MFTMGIDIGSASSKVVILKDGAELVKSAVVQRGTGSSGPGTALKTALEGGGLTLDDMDMVVATGYGRMNCSFAQKQISEISCHARGAFYQVPLARTVIDIGGQDAKVILLNDDGTIDQFFMNDKCAAGTGRFLDVMARVLETEVGELEQYDAAAERISPISSTCTVFAESEVISQLSCGVPKADIVAGVHQSVASKICGLVYRGACRDQIVMSGGVALNSGVVKAVGRALKRPVSVVPEPQITGALGAALLACSETAKCKSQGLITERRNFNVGN